MYLPYRAGVAKCTLRICMVAIDHIIALNQYVYAYLLSLLCLHTYRLDGKKDLLSVPGGSTTALKNL